MFRLFYLFVSLFLFGFVVLFQFGQLVFFWLRQDLALLPRLASSLSLPNAGSTGMCHHVHLGPAVFIMKPQRMQAKAEQEWLGTAAS